MSIKRHVTYRVEDSFNFSNDIGYFLCEACAFEGSLSSAVEHAVTNQYKVQDDISRPKLAITQDSYQRPRELSRARTNRFASKR